MRRSPGTTGRLFFEEQDRLRGGPAEELCAAGYTAHLANYPPMDLDGHAKFSTEFYLAFPDLQHVIEDVVANTEAVAVRFTMRGTHCESFMGIPASARPVQVGGIAMMRVIDGRVEELHGQFDQLALTQQIEPHPA